MRLKNGLTAEDKTVLAERGMSVEALDFFMAQSTEDCLGTEIESDVLQLPPNGDCKNLMRHALTAASDHNAQWAQLFAFVFQEPL